MSESRRSATQRTPVARLTAAPRRFTEPGGEEVTTTSMPCLRTSLIAAGTAVRSQGELGSGTSRRLAVSAACRRRRATPVRPGELFLGPVDARGEVPRLVDDRRGRRHERLVAVHALRVRGHQHVRLDPELGQVRCHLERARNAAAARRGPVHRRQKNLHVTRL